VRVEGGRVAGWRGGRGLLGWVEGLESQVRIVREMEERTTMYKRAMYEEEDNRGGRGRVG